MAQVRRHHGRRKRQRAQHAGAGPTPPPSARAPAAAPGVVPLVDEQQARRIYDPSLLHFALWGAAAGALLLGYLAYALGSGMLGLTGLGQFAAAGPGPATFTGAGLGVALGGLIGALIALHRLPRRS